MGKIQVLGKVGAHMNQYGCFIKKAKLGKVENDFSHNEQNSRSRQSWQSWGHL